MSTLAKILVIVNLVLAVAFFGVTSTLFMTRYNWRLSYEELKTETAAALQTQMDSFEPYKANMNNLRTENRGLLESRNALQATNKTLNDEVANLKTEIGDLRSVNESQLALLKEKEEAVQRLTDNVASLNSTNDDLRSAQERALDEKKAAVEAYTSLSIDLSKTQEELTNARASLTEANQQVDKYEVMIAQAKANGMDIEIYQQPQIEGRIEAVSSEEDIVVLSVGKDQKVQHGHLFSVRRGANYIGKLEVIDVYQDLSGARVIYLKENETLEPGDTIETFRS